jgi:membrane-bound lytic murein transglycosylase A
MHVGYDGSNGHDYTSVSQLLIADGKLDKNHLSLPAVQSYFARHRDELDGYIWQNDRYVFFSEYNGTNWPAGSLGFSVQAGRTVATDKSVFPRGGVVLVDTQSPRGGGQGPFRRFMLDQDTGGAIRAAGRADLYMGVGDSAEAIAGRQYAEGRLYYLFLKADRVAHWRQRMGLAPTAALAQR